MSSKACTKCGEDKPFNAFGVHRTNTSGLKGACKKCNNAYSRAKSALELQNNYEKYGIKATARHVKLRYGITLETYRDRMSTSSCCQVCGSKDRLCHDHCHNTSVFRGVLCNKCNTGIGMLGDSAEGIKAALAYLEEHEGVGYE